MPKQIEWSTFSGGNLLFYTVNFDYDGQSRRVKKTKSWGYETYYVGDHFEVDSGTEVKYIFAGNQRVAKVTAAGTHFFHKDHLGSSNVVTDYTNAAVVETSEYMPFGQTREHSGTVISSYKFTDQELDVATGLYNYDARLYDPVVGRFISADSIVPDLYDPQALNRYAYVLNNPLAYIDPDGHAAADWADAWEVNAAESSAALDQMVSAHSWTWPIAAAAQTAMDVAAGTVDMLKIGEGVAEGGAENIAADIGRASGIVLVVAGASAKYVPKGAPSSGANNNATMAKLKKQLASESQVAEVNAGNAERIAGAGTGTKFRDAHRVAKEYGGDAADWAKVKSSTVKQSGSYGTKIGTHAVQNVKTGKVVEHKTKLFD